MAHLPRTLQDPHRGSLCSYVQTEAVQPHGVGTQGGREAGVSQAEVRRFGDVRRRARSVAALRDAGRLCGRDGAGQVDEHGDRAR